MPGGIEVELPSGVRLRFGSDVDGPALAAHSDGAGDAMMLPPATRVYLACGFTDMRKGFDGLAAQVQTVLSLDPYGGALFIFRGRRGDSAQGAALGWPGPLSLRQAARVAAGPVRLAADGQRHRYDDGGAGVDATGRN